MGALPRRPDPSRGVSCSPQARSATGTLRSLVIHHPEARPSGGGKAPTCSATTAVTSHLILSAAFLLMKS
jgi:hypothetical protein